VRLLAGMESARAMLAGKDAVRVEALRSAGMCGGLSTRGRNLAE
jgi:hypothetical protein